MNVTSKPTLQQFHLEGVNHISPSLAYDAVKSGEAMMLDVREENEWLRESIALDDILYHPMSVIMERLNHIPTDKVIIVVCKAGERSTKVANLLNRFDYKNVANLDGGIIQWKELGLPVESNLSAGCGCGTTTAAPKTSEPASSCGCPGCGTGCC